MKNNSTLEELTLNEGNLCRKDNNEPVTYGWMNGPWILKVPLGRNNSLKRIKESAPEEANAYLTGYGVNVPVREPMGGTMRQQYRTTSVTHLPVMYFRIEKGN